MHNHQHILSSLLCWLSLPLHCLVPLVSSTWLLCIPHAPKKSSAQWLGFCRWRFLRYDNSSQAFNIGKRHCFDAVNWHVRVAKVSLKNDQGTCQHQQLKLSDLSTAEGWLLMKWQLAAD
jgi:hypothetical protein